MPLIDASSRWLSQSCGELLNKPAVVLRRRRRLREELVHECHYLLGASPYDDPYQRVVRLLDEYLYLE